MKILNIKDNLRTLAVILFLPLWVVISSVIIAIWIIVLTIIHLPIRLMDPHTFWSKHKFYNRSLK